MSQTARLIAFLRANPGASSIELTLALRLVNVTGRVSDARASGHVIDARRVDGVFRYFLIEGQAEPGYAAFGADVIEQKMKIATSPIGAMLEAWDRVFGAEADARHR